MALTDRTVKIKITIPEITPHALRLCITIEQTLNFPCHFDHLLRRESFTDDSQMDGASDVSTDVKRPVSN